MRKLLGRIRSALLAVRTTWAIFGVTLVLLILMEGTFRLVFWAKDLRSAPPFPDPRMIELGYNNESWAVDHFHELERLEERWQPFVYFRQKLFPGRTITVGADGHRAIWTPTSRPKAARKPIKIMFLGGSALWGWGARDDHTIPSYVAKELDRRGILAETRNLAEIGYVSTQELITLIGDLEDGNRPDLVVFFDGVNDTAAAALEGIAGVSTDESDRRREFNITQSPGRLIRQAATYVLKNSATLRLARSIRRRLLGSDAATDSPTSSADGIRQLADKVVNRYEANRDVIQRLGQAYGFHPLFFWQPVIYDKPNRVEFEEQEAKNFEWAKPVFDAVYGKIRNSTHLKSDPTFRDLTALFKEEPNLVFVDYCHMTEAANARVASAIAEQLVKQIEAVSPAQ